LTEGPPLWRILPSPFARAHPPQEPEEVFVAAKSGFTRIPKVQYLVSAGVPVEAIPTYCALADHANNKNGLCWPKMQTLAKILGRSARTVQRHLHTLKELGLVEFVSRRRYRGRFGSYLYRVLAIPSMARKKRASTTGHARRLANPPPIFPRTKGSRTAPSYSPSDPYRWWKGLDTHYMDKELADQEGQMRLLALAGEALTDAERAAEGSGGSKKGSSKGRGSKERPGASSNEQLF
jgi:DNA-binding transcriptional ArsR family regulator